MLRLFNLYVYYILGASATANDVAPTKEWGLCKRFDFMQAREIRAFGIVENGDRYLRLRTGSWNAN